MAEDGEHEPFDLYSDAFTITITPFGANLTFAVREPHPAVGRQQQTTNLGTVRMSNEHLKTMVMIIRRQVIQVEEKTGVKAEVPRDVLNQMGIGPDDWDLLWRSSGGLG